MNSPFSRTITQNRLTQIYTGVAYQEDSECSWMAELQFGKTWKWFSSNDQQHIWQSLKNLENNKWVNIVQSRCVKLLETYPEKLTAVISANGDSNMY